MPNHSLGRRLAYKFFWLEVLLERIRSSPLLSRLATGTAWSVGGTLVSRVFSLIATIVIARLLGKEDYGAYGIVQSTFGMFGLFAGLGIGSTAAKYVAEFKRKDPARAGRLLALSR